MPRKFLLAFLALGLAGAGVATAGDNWPQFRGPNASGVVEDPRLPVTWNKSQNVAWCTDIVGRGWSSPIVWQDRVFVTAVHNPDAPKSEKGLYFKSLIGKEHPGENACYVYCLDFKTGKILWKQLATRGKAKSQIHIKNTYASETPVTDGKRIYAYFGNHGLYCYDLEGKLLWSKDMGTYKTRMGWGTGASPILYRGRLYIINDNEEKSFLAALEPETGNEIWRVERDEKTNWSTPYIWENSLRTEIVTSGTGKVRSYDLDGKLLWELQGMTSITIPTPTAQGDLLFVSSGYVLAAERPVYAIKPGAQGDISLKKGETKNDYIVWVNRKAAPYHPSPLVYKGHLYVLEDRGLLSCFDAATGKEIYSRKRLPASAFTACPWAYQDCIFCLSEDGETFVVKAGSDFEVLGRNPLEEMALATPAIVQDSLIIRTDSRLYRIRENKSQ